MEKSVEELESLIKLRDMLKIREREERASQTFTNMLDKVSSGVDLPDSVLIGSRAMKRICESNTKILNEEILIVEQSIASYNEAFGNSKTK